MFEYLDGCNLYQAFSDLNHRFQQLLSSSLLRLKIKVYCSESNEITMNNYNKIVLHNKQQIFSISIWTLKKPDPMASSFNFDSSFNRLESLVISSIEPDLLLSILPKLALLTRLFSLKIDALPTLEDLSIFYQFIFSLPKLKYIKYTTPDSKDSNTTISLPAATKEQITSIEYFIIDHLCTYDQLSNLLSYTPNLRYLKYLNLYGNKSDVQSIKLGTFPYLTHLSINNYEMNFDEFEIFIKKFNCSQLKILSFSTIVDDLSYLNSDRWEQFILQNLTQLKEFYFKFQASLYSEYQTPPYSGAQNPFMSQFWIQRQWILDTEIESDNIIYSIRPYKKRWYEHNVQDNTMDSFDEWSKSMRLVLSDAYQEEWCKSLTVKNYIHHVLTVTQIYHLYIYFQISIDKLSNILQMLPELDSLEIYRFLYTDSDDPLLEDIESPFDLIAKNRITKLYLNTVSLAEEIYFFMEIFQCIIQLKVQLKQSVDMESFVRDILLHLMMKPDSPLQFLCLCSEMADDLMVQKIKNMIENENLLFDFNIIRVMNEIHLQWN
ncbi:unnamed protein product [Rotaria socialis]|nr:unnamed protein product [Rotaria socialis]CAF3381100.1 unnamed protein product [Rotaria socialis]CAF4489145.1 unnamed protein product [Rotaria socialis]CAF4514963.1 unnamed protein product [Rotaria socialis]CAF4562993.1 unnamed protein product [Rotaria socialis]